MLSSYFGFEVRGHLLPRTRPWVEHATEFVCKANKSELKGMKATQTDNIIGFREFFIHLHCWEDDNHVVPFFFFIEQDDLLDILNTLILKTQNTWICI